MYDKRNKLVLFSCKLFYKDVCIFLKVNEIQCNPSLPLNCWRYYCIAIMLKIIVITVTGFICSTFKNTLHTHTRARAHTRTYIYIFRQIKWKVLHCITSTLWIWALNYHHLISYTDWTAWSQNACVMHTECTLWIQESSNVLRARYFLKTKMSPQVLIQCIACACARK